MNIRLLRVFTPMPFALESADRAGIHRSMGRLARLLSEGAGSAAIFEVAERVCALFSTPVQGVDFEATTALLLIAQELVGQPRTEPDMSISASEIPAPTDLLSGNATETAVRVLRMAESLRGHPAMPSWLRPVLRLYDCQGGPGTRFNDSFEQYLEARGHSDSLRAYRALKLSARL